MVWVVDRGLIRLRDQVNEAAPGRSKASDGTIGDLAHQAEQSDHNPEDADDAPGNPDEQVDALDLTHDLAAGADMGVITEAIRTSKDRRVSYVIWNRRIFSGPDGPQPFVWRPYSGSDPHTNHAHVSVRDATHDQTQDWEIGMALTSEEHQWLQSIKTRLQASATGAATYPVDWTANPADKETNKAIIQAGQIAATLNSVVLHLTEIDRVLAGLKVTVDELAARPPVVAPPITGNVTVTGNLTVLDGP